MRGALLGGLAAVVLSLACTGGVAAAEAPPTVPGSTGAETQQTIGTSPSGPGLPTGSAALGEPSAALACTTWQYMLMDWPRTVRSSPGGTVVATLNPPPNYTAVWANITDRPGSWYYGNYYYGQTGGPEVWVASGWILAEYLAYARCY